MKEEKIPSTYNDPETGRLANDFVGCILEPFKEKHFDDIDFWLRFYKERTELYRDTEKAKQELEDIGREIGNNEIERDDWINRYLTASARLIAFVQILFVNKKMFEKTPDRETDDYTNISLGIDNIVSSLAKFSESLDRRNLEKDKPGMYETLIKTMYGIRKMILSLVKDGTLFAEKLRSALR